MMKLPVASLFVLLAASCATGPNAIGARNESTFAAAVHPGVSQAQVEQALGPPDKRERFPMSGNEGWDYKYQDGWGYMALYSITFSPDGYVVSAISNRINSGGDHK
jgi:hypothetical protein